MLLRSCARRASSAEVTCYNDRHRSPGLPLYSIYTAGMWGFVGFHFLRELADDDTDNLALSVVVSCVLAPFWPVIMPIYIFNTMKRRRRDY
jgi:hypothetical protein